VAGRRLLGRGRHRGYNFSTELLHHHHHHHCRCSRLTTTCLWSVDWLSATLTMGTTSSKLAVVGGVTAAAVVAGGVYIATRSSTGDDVASSVPADMPASSTTAATDDAVPAGGVAATDETVCVGDDSTPANGPATGHPVAEPVPVPPVDGSALSESPSAAPTTAPTAVTSNAAVSSDDNSGSKVGNHAPVPSLTPQVPVSASSPVRVGPGTPAETAPEPTPAVATVTPKGKSASNAPTCPIEGTQDEDTPSPAPAKAFVPPEIDSEDEYDANTAVSSSFLPDMMTESAGVSIGEFATANAYLAEQVTKLVRATVVASGHELVLSCVCCLNAGAGCVSHRKSCSPSSCWHRCGCCAPRK